MDSAWTYVDTGRLHRGHGDPGGPAVAVHVPGGQRGLVPDPRLLGRLHGRRPRLRPLLRLPQLLRLLDAAAGPGGQLRAADRRLGVRRRGLIPADLVLVPAQHRHPRRHQGVRDQRDRRRRAGDRRLPAVQRDRRARLRGRLRGRRRGLPPQRGHARGRLPPDPGRRLRQVGPAAAPHLAPGRHGGPHAGQRPDPRRHDGHRRRLPDRAHPPALRARADRGGHQRDHRHGHAAVRGDGGADGHGPQARDRVLARSRRSATWCSASRSPPTAPASST